MNEDTVEKILDIKVRYDDAIKKIADYNVKVKELKDQEGLLTARWKDGQIESHEYYTQLTALKTQSSQYTDSVRVLTKEIQNNIKAEEQQQGSLVSMRASLSNLTRQYDEMSEAERNSASGQDLEIHINAITDQIKEAEEKTQRFYRNVGSYQEAFEKALSPLKKQLDEVTTTYLSMSDEERKGAKGDEMRKHIQEIKDQLKETSEAGGVFQNKLLELTGAQGGLLGSISNSVGGIKNLSQAFMAGKAAVSAFSKQLLVLLANPIVAILAGIAVAIMAVVKAINSSEEASNRWNAIIAPLTRTMNFLLNIIQQLAGGILYVVEAGAKLTNWLASMAEKIPKIGKYIKDVNDANREAIELEKEKAAIEKQTRADEVQNAKDAYEVSKLRTLAKDKEKYTSEERLKFVKEANKLEEEQSKRNVELAERRFKALKKESEWAENDAETNRELAKLEADVYRARKEYFDKTRELKEQENTLMQESANKAKAEAESRKKSAEEAVKIQKERVQKELDAIRQAEDAVLSLLKDGAEKQRKGIQLSYKRQIEDLQRKLKEEQNLTKKAREEINKTIVALQQKQEQELQKVSNEQLTKEIDNRQKLIELQLASVKSGSDQEYQLKMNQLLTQQEMELSNAELTEEMKLAIKVKYNKQIDDLAMKHEKDISDKQQEAIRLRYEVEIEQAYNNEQEVLRIKMEQKKAELDSLQQMEGESLEAFNLRKQQLENEYLDSKQAVADKEVEIEQEKLQAMSDITNGLVSLLDAMGENNKAFAKLSKVLALAEIAINTGKAIAAGVAQAQSVPFPGNIAAIATTITAVLSNIATAIKTVKSAKFAFGGLVTGSGTGTSDSIPAQLSNGESVITARATEMFAPILSSFNMMGGGVPINITTQGGQTLGEDMLARAVAKGVQSMPTPVVSVEEINQVNYRVAALENLSSI